VGASAVVVASACNRGLCCTLPSSASWVLFVYCLLLLFVVCFKNRTNRLQLFAFASAVAAAAGVTVTYCSRESENFSVCAGRWRGRRRRARTSHHIFARCTGASGRRLLIALALSVICSRIGKRAVVAGCFVRSDIQRVCPRVCC